MKIEKCYNYNMYLANENKRRFLNANFDKDLRFYLTKLLKKI